jgi:hypothetical protein
MAANTYFVQWTGSQVEALRAKNPTTWIKYNFCLLSSSLVKTPYKNKEPGLSLELAGDSPGLTLKAAEKHGPPPEKGW